MWSEYKQRFPRPFIEGIFDPKGFGDRIDTSSSNTNVEIQPAVHTVSATPTQPPPFHTKPRSVDLLPAPFAWINIPAGKVKLEEEGYVAKDGQIFDVAAFVISKYPVTNAQYAKFVETGGYRQKRWWPEAGWAQREKGQWTEPEYWQDKKWNSPEQPVVGVSWYESVAFSQWLSEIGGETIMLATEQQWQCAAQGDKGLKYPWGNEWDGKRCSNSVKPEYNNQTTPMRQYEGQGSSPFGVVDMAGNVWEWSLTSYIDGTHDINRDTAYRVLRGGSWDDIHTDSFRCAYRDRSKPHGRHSIVGFRLVLP